MERKRVILLSIILIVIAASIAYSLSESLFVYSVVEFDMHAKVVEGKMVGVNIDTDALYFGKIRKGGLSTRWIIVDNQDEDPHLIRIRTFGDLSKWVYVSDNNFILANNESRRVTVSCDVPQEAEVGNYTGRLQVVYLNVWGWA